MAAEYQMPDQMNCSVVRASPCCNDIAPVTFTAVNARTDQYSTRDPRSPCEQGLRLNVSMNWPLDTNNETNNMASPIDGMVRALAAERNVGGSSHPDAF